MPPYPIQHYAFLFLICITIFAIATLINWNTFSGTFPRFKNASSRIIISKTNRFIVSYNNHSYLYSIFKFGNQCLTKHKKICNIVVALNSKLFSVFVFIDTHRSLVAEMCVFFIIRLSFMFHYVSSSSDFSQSMSAVQSSVIICSPI